MITEQLAIQDNVAGLGTRIDGNVKTGWVCAGNTCRRHPPGHRDIRRSDVLVVPTLVVKWGPDRRLDTKCLD